MRSSSTQHIYSNGLTFFFDGKVDDGRVSKYFWWIMRITNLGSHEQTEVLIVWNCLLTQSNIRFVVCNKERNLWVTYTNRIFTTVQKAGSSIKAVPKKIGKSRKISCFVLIFRLQTFWWITFWCFRVDPAPKLEVLCLLSPIWWETYYGMGMLRHGPHESKK
jgi:hypothetical protein